MIGLNLHDPISNITGKVEAQTVQPDGKAIVRICDRWLDVDGLVPA